jgi:hypothetical protein
MVGMRFTSFLILAQCALAQPGLDVVKEYYKQTLAALRQAKTKDDLTKLVETLDAPDWVSIDPAGFVVQTRAQTAIALEPFLKIAPEKRPLPNIEVLWVHDEPWRVTAVSIVLGPHVTVPSPPRAASKSTFGSATQPHFMLAGSLIRDTFARTAEGWRRIKHEKLLPDQLRVPSEESVVPAPR